MKNRTFCLGVLCLLGMSMVDAQSVTPTGVVINHISQQEGRYVGSPSICVLPDGCYLASHDEFGPQSTENVSAITHVFLSTDKGVTWKQVARLDGQFWSTLFVHKGSVYIMGCKKAHGNVVIRRSNDDGHTWTTPDNASDGLILEGKYHTAPVPVIIHKGRIWRAVEDASSPDKRWPQRYSAMILSAPVNSDLLNAKSWRRSNFLRIDTTCLNHRLRGWLEGNAVVAPDGSVMDILRTEVTDSPDDYAAFVKISRHGKKASFDAATGFFPFPGGGKKFTIRYDESTHLYWTLVNPKFLQVPDKKRYSVRNILSLCSSPDLKNWTQHKVILFHPERLYHAFQYVDWQIDGNDMIFASRTAYDDSTGGAHSFHDANYLTFYRIPNFRSLMSEVVDMSRYVTNEEK